LPLSTSCLDHLAKHFVAFQCDVVGLFDGLFCNLLAVQVELDVLWRDANVELRERDDGGGLLLTKKSCPLKTPRLPNLL